MIGDLYVLNSYITESGGEALSPKKASPPCEKASDRLVYQTPLSVTFSYVKDFSFICGQVYTCLWGMSRGVED